MFVKRERTICVMLMYRGRLTVNTYNLPGGTDSW